LRKEACNKEWPGSSGHDGKGSKVGVSSCYLVDL
jgi:hypothetical protein